MQNKAEAIAGLGPSVQAEFGTLDQAVKLVTHPKLKPHAQNTAFSVIHSVLARLMPMLQRLAQLVKPPTPSCSAGRVIAVLFRLWLRTIPKRIRLLSCVEDNLPPVAIEASELERDILGELIENAREAIGSKPGRITLKVGRDDRMIVFTVADTGPGIAADVREHAFEPGVGTKPSGLGLTRVREAVKKARGAITCTTGRQGTVFVIQIPLAD